MSPETPQRHAQWWILTSCAITAMLLALNVASVGASLPWLQTFFGATRMEMVGAMTAPLIASVVVNFASAHLAARWGEHTVFVLGLGGWLLCTALCAIAETSSHFVAYRVLQAIPTICCWTSLFALTVHTFEGRERARALAYIEVATTVGACLGPLVSGLMMSSTLWRWMFWGLLPIGGVALGIALLTAPRREPKASMAETATIVPSLAAGVGLALLCCVLFPELRALVPPAIGLAGAGIATLIAFGTARRTPASHIALRSLLRRQAVISFVGFLLAWVSVTTLDYTAPYVLAHALRLDAQTAGSLLLLSIALPRVVGSLVTLLASRAVAISYVAVGGVALVFVGFLWLLSQDFSELPLSMLLAYACVGIGTGMFAGAGGAVFLSSVIQTHRTLASAVRNVAPPLGKAAGISLAAFFLPVDTLASLPQQFSSPLRICYFAAALLACASLICAAGSLRMASSSKWES